MSITRSNRVKNLLERLCEEKQKQLCMIQNVRVADFIQSLYSKSPVQNWQSRAFEIAPTSDYFYALLCTLFMAHL